MNTWTEKLDTKARTLAVEYQRTEAVLLSVLMEMKQKKVFPELNCSGIFEYCERVLKLSKAQSYYFKTVADISLSQARRIAPVVTAENQSHWIAQAKTLPQVSLEKKVAEANPKARPRETIRPVARELSELKVPIDEETERHLLALKDILSTKLGRSASFSEVIAFAAKVTRERLDPVEKAKRAKSVSSRKRMTRKEGRQSLPATVRHEVVRRDGNQCSFVGKDGRRCTEQRWLHYS